MDFGKPFMWHNLEFTQQITWDNYLGGYEIG